ncbi:MAG: diaminopimelate epimerase [Helicobacteraceae bacterium]|jgi:diaminopimelate epimerase|nr:diaminopimelate epimerase [Helicobacteraceae bacterium]
MICSKYSASGNDFIVTSSFKKADRRELALRLCDRNHGVGADGLIVLVPHSEYDYAWEFYNADGSFAALCGNGARAAALYAFDNKLAGEKQRFLTGAGAIEAIVGTRGLVEARLTEPKIIRDNIQELGLTWRLIDAGVPHLTTHTRLSIFDRLPLSELRMKYDANIDVYSVKSRMIKVRTFERGVEAETLACGTGMAACFFALYNEKKVASPCIVFPRNGDKTLLSIVDNRVCIKGKTVKLFDAIINDEPAV